MSGVENPPVELHSDFSATRGLEIMAAYFTSVDGILGEENLASKVTLSHLSRSPSLKLPAGFRLTKISCHTTHLTLPTHFSNPVRPANSAQRRTLMTR